MKKIQTCTNNSVLVALLLLGVVMAMGGYRIFSYLCELPTMAEPVAILLAVCSAALAVCGFLLARVSFRRLQYLRDHTEAGGEETQKNN